MTVPDTRPIALIGLMGAGKSSVARELGERLGVSVADLDSMLEASEGCTVAEYFARSGEEAFRRREGELLEQVLRAGVSVIACGGGTVLDEGSRALLRERCHVVWLEVSPAEALRRVNSAGPPASIRPLLAGDDPGSRLESLLAERASLYAETATRRIATGGRDAAQVAGEILSARTRE